MWIASQALSLGHSIHEEKKETELYFSTTGAKCVALVESAISDVVNGNMAAASKTVGELTKYAVELAEQSEQMAAKMNKAMVDKKQKTEMIQRDISDLHEQENALRLRTSHKEASLKIKQEEHSRAQVQLSNAKNELKHAQKNAKKAKKKGRRRRLFSTIVGGILGTFTPIPGVGTVVGGLAGNKVGDKLSDKDERKAQQVVKKHEKIVNRFQHDINSLQREISMIKTEVSKTMEQIKSQEEKRLKTNEDAKQMKGAAVFFHNASTYWKEIAQAAEHGGDRAELLQRIIDKAKEKEDLDFLKCDGCKKVAMTFVEAWDAMVTKYAEEYEFFFSSHTPNTLGHDEL